MIKSMLTDCLEMLAFGTNWENLTFFGQRTNLLGQSPNGQELVTDVQLRFIPYIHHTSDYRQYCHVDTAQHC